jgi:hypothetical protein
LNLDAREGQGERRMADGTQGRFRSENAWVRLAQRDLRIPWASRRPSKGGMSVLCCLARVAHLLGPVDGLLGRKGVAAREQVFASSVEALGDAGENLINRTLYPAP